MDSTFPTGLPRPRPRPRPRPLPRPRPPRPPACPSSLTPLSMHNRTACVSAAAPQPWANYTQRCMEERTQTSWQLSSAPRVGAGAMGAWAQTAREARGRATSVTQHIQRHYPRGIRAVMARMNTPVGVALPLMSRILQARAQLRPGAPPYDRPLLPRASRRRWVESAEPKTWRRRCDQGHHHIHTRARGRFSGLGKRQTGSGVRRRAHWVAYPSLAGRPIAPSAREAGGAEALDPTCLGCKSKPPPPATPTPGRWPPAAGPAELAEPTAPSVPSELRHSRDGTEVADPAFVRASLLRSVPPAPRVAASRALSAIVTSQSLHRGGQAARRARPIFCWFSLLCHKGARGAAAGSALVLQFLLFQAA